MKRFWRRVPSRYLVALRALGGHPVAYRVHVLGQMRVPSDPKSFVADSHFEGCPHRHRKGTKLGPLLVMDVPLTGSPITGWPMPRAEFGPIENVKP